MSTAKTLFVVADGFFSAMLTVILACYTEFEDRVGLIGKTGSSSTAYIVEKSFDMRYNKLLHFSGVTGDYGDSRFRERNVYEKWKKA